jgi:hypothetical protein
MNIDVNKQVKEITYNGTPLTLVGSDIEEAVLIEKTITENGTYIASNDDADGYESVTVDVPEPVLDDLTITKNGKYTPPDGVDGYDDITVNVPSEEPVLDSLSIDKNGTYTPPDGTDGYNKITVDVPSTGITPVGTLTITSNGVHDVYNYASANVNVPSKEPVLDTLSVTKNGKYTPSSGVDGYDEVNVNIPEPVLDDLSITANGKYTPPTGTDGYNSITVKVPEPVLDDLTITANGTYIPSGNTDGYDKVVVNVPSSGITPTGTLNITTNGTHNVYNYASAKVNVPTSDPVLRTISITENGTYTPPSGVDGYKQIDVNVDVLPDDVELAPIYITENGTYQASDNGVDGFEFVQVNVPIPEEPVLISKGITANGVYEASDDNVDGYNMVVVDLDASGNTITFTENGTYDAKNFYSNKLGFGVVKVMVAQHPDFMRPTIGFVPTEYDANGLTLKGIWYGTRVSDGAFKEQRNLTDIIFEDTVTKIESNAFYYATGLTMTELPDTITTIGNSAFYGCNAPLTKLPDSLTSIGTSAFRSSGVAIQEIPVGVTEIPNYCFYWCSNITDITLYANINSIGSNGFGKNENLDTVTFKGTPTTIDNSAFSSCTGIRLITVPWAEGEVAGAPWGATNATIVYNYTV